MNKILKNNMMDLLRNIKRKLIREIKKLMNLKKIYQKLPNNQPISLVLWNREI